ncbi:MAG: formyltransferase family protein [Candidatus Zixiibacteriota bacterium]
MNIAITTDSAINLYASTLICALSRGGFTPACVVSVEKSKAAKLRHELKRNGVASTFRKAVGSRYSVASPHGDPFSYLRDYAAAHNLDAWNTSLPILSTKLGIEYLSTENVNSEFTVKSIMDRDIDIVVNAGGGIFRKAIVMAPKIGILNAHMGFLPTFRGMNVLEWSLFHRHNPGVTLHFIDTGIDTGNILLFRKIELCMADTIDSLRAKALPVSVEAVTEGVRGLADGSLRAVSQRPQDGEQYFVMHERLKRVAEKNIAALVESRITQSP